MAKDLKKFVNPKFIRTISLELMRTLLERHRAALDGLDFDIFDGDPDLARAALEGFFAGPDGDIPKNIVADLHQIAAVGTRRGLEILLEQAARVRGCLALSLTSDLARQDPKHVALLAFLHHREVFDAASRMVSYYAGQAIAEFFGAEVGQQPRLDAVSQRAFRDAAAALFEADLHGNFCQVTNYDDGPETTFVTAHGTPLAMSLEIEAGEEVARPRQPSATAFLAYSPSEARLKMRGVSKKRRAPLAEAFARHILGVPGFFRGHDSQDLYTLAPLERDWPEVRLTHKFDPQIKRVAIVEVQADRVAVNDLLENTYQREWSVLVQDYEQSALARLREVCPAIEFASGGWRLSHVVLDVFFNVGARKLDKVRVEIRPKAEARFKRQRFEDQIMEFLRRNEFCRVRNADRRALAAE